MRSWTNWFPEAEEKAMLAYVKSRLRMMARRKNPKTGLPELASVEVPCDEDGRFERVYKQLSCFDPEDYRQVCSYHSEQARHHRRLAKAYADDCRRRFGIQMPSKSRIQLWFCHSLAVVFFLVNFPVSQRRSGLNENWVCP